jgi:hypothetical protein
LGAKQFKNRSAYKGNHQMALSLPSVHSYVIITLSLLLNIVLVFEAKHNAETWSRVGRFAKATASQGMLLVGYTHYCMLK